MKGFWSTNLSTGKAEVQKKLALSSWGLYSTWSSSVRVMEDTLDLASVQIWENLSFFLQFFVSLLTVLFYFIYFYFYHTPLWTQQASSSESYDKFVSTLLIPTFSLKKSFMLMTLPGESIKYNVSSNTHLQLDHDSSSLEYDTRKCYVVEGKTGMGKLWGNWLEK